MRYCFFTVEYIYDHKDVVVDGCISNKDLLLGFPEEKLPEKHRVNAEYTIDIKPEQIVK